MKQVLSSIPPAQVTLALNVTPHKYYGVIVGDDKGVIIKTDYNFGKYVTVSTREMFTAANGWTAGSSAELVTYVNFLLQWAPCKGVFEFNSFKELGDWSAQKLDK